MGGGVLKGQGRARNIFDLDAQPLLARHMRPMTDAPIDEEVVAIHARLFAERLKLGEVLNRAGVARSTWSRWARGSIEPKKSTLRRVHAAIDAKVEEKKS